MMLFSHGYGSSPYGGELASGELTAVLLRNVPRDGLPAGAVLGAFWGQDVHAEVDAGAAVAIAFGAPTPGDVAELCIAGAVDAQHAFAWPVVPGENVARDIPLQLAVPAGADVYVVFGLSYSGTAPRVAAAGMFDRLRAGLVRTADAAGASLLELIGQTRTFAPRVDRWPVQLAVTVALPAGA